MRRGTVMIMAVSVFLVNKTTPTTRCEAPAVVEHKPGKITCYYNTDVNLTKMDFTVSRYDKDNQYTVILHCFWVNNDQPDCKVQEGYDFDGKITNKSALDIASATKEHAGRYVCQVIPSDPDDLVSCNFIVKDLQLNITTENNSSAAGNEPEDSSQTTIIAGVVSGLTVTCVITAVVIIVLRKLKRGNLKLDTTKDGISASELSCIQPSAIDREENKDPSMKTRGIEDKQAVQDTSFSVNSGPTADTPLLNKEAHHHPEEDSDSRRDMDILFHKSQEKAPPVPPRTHKKTEENSSETEQFSLSRLSLKSNLDQERENHSKTDLGKQSHISHLSDSRSKPFVHSTRKPNENAGVMSSDRENVTGARRSLELRGTDGSSGPPAYPTSRSPPAGQNQTDQVKQSHNKPYDIQQHYNRHQYDTQIEANNDNVPGVNSVGAKAWNTCTKRPTPLHESCRNGDESAVKDLLSSNASVDAVDDAGQTPLHVACQNGSTFVVKLLLDARARTDVKDRQGCTPLHVGCKTDSASVVEMLLRAGANTKEKDIKGCTPLHVACQNNATSVVNSLLRVGASTEARNDDSYTPLHVACLLGSRPLVDMLLKRRAKLEAGDKTGRTPLHVASETDIESVVECLLDAGADVNAEDKLRRTPLFVACENRRETTASILIRSGAKVEVKSNSGRQPLHAACQSGSASTAKLLLDAGANTESTDTSGYTPLHLACDSGEPSVVNLLLSFCARIEAKNRFGQTPLDIARDAGKEAVCQILLDAAANQ